MNSRGIFFVAVIGIGAQAHASFSGVSEYGAAFTYQADSGIFRNQYFPGTGPFSANDPYTTNNDGADIMATQLDFHATSVISSNYLELDGSFRGYASTHLGNPTGTLESNSQAYDELFFTSSGITFVTLTAFNASSSSGGFNYGFSEMNFDGSYYQFSPGNTTASFTVGAGAHYMWYDVSCNVYSGVSYGADSFNQTSSDYKLTASSVPEPATMSVLGIGILQLLRRRKARA